MIELKEKSYVTISDKSIDFVIGTLVYVLSILPLLFPQIGDAIFSFLSRSGLGNERDALGFAVITTIVIFGLPVIVGILTFLMTQKRKYIFGGYLSALIVSVIVRVAIAIY